MSARRIIWLASYPKSGNTWIRTFLANYILGNVGINELRSFSLSDVRADFYLRAAGGRYDNVSFSDWLRHRQNALRLIHDAREGTHFVKTHNRIDSIEGLPLIPPALTAAAIYILRNPFDIAPSYARHIGTDLDTAIATMTARNHVAAAPPGIYEVLGSWDTHVDSWTGARGLPMVTVRYEDLLADPKRGFAPIFDFLKITPHPRKLKQTIRATSFASLRQQEDAGGFVERPAGMDKFFHSGRAGGWRETLSDAQVAALYRAFEPTLRKWYPELVEETGAIAERAGS